MSEYIFNQQERLYLQRHMESMRRGGVRNPDGSVSTVRGVVMGDGEYEYLIPTVWGGRIVSNEDAWSLARKKGLESFPRYKTVDEALRGERELKKLINKSFEDSK